MSKITMNILQIIIAFIPSSFGGIKNHVYYQSKEMIKRGHNVTVYTSNAYNMSENNDRYGLHDIEGIKVRYFNRPFPRKLFLIHSMIPYLRNNISQFDLIHLQDFRTFINVIAYYYARKNNIPYVISAGGSMPWGSNPFKIIKKFLFDLIIGNNMLRNSARLVALSEIEIEQYEKTGIIRDHIEIVPNGIDPSEMSKDIPKGYFRNKYNIKDQFIISFVGRIHEIKGLEYLVKSFVVLLKSLPSTKLVIAGEDHGYLIKLKNVIKKYDVSEKILFPGFISGDDKWSLYRDSDLFIIPSKYEGFGNVVPEAAINKTPIILSDGCAIAPIVKKNGFGEIVPYDNVKIMSDTMYIILSDETLRKIMSEKGVEFVLKNWTWVKSTDILLDVYTKSLSNSTSIK
jgi:glycosyltransferase involved in cell wall biosynthesis